MIMRMPDEFHDTLMNFKQNMSEFSRTFLSFALRMLTQTFLLAFLFFAFTILLPHFSVQKKLSLASL